jgi:hypothetical protein
VTDSSLPPAADQNSSSFVARGGLQRTIKYRNILRLTYFALLGLAAASLVTGFLYTGIAVSKGEPLNPLWLTALLIGVPFASFAIARLRVRPYAFTTVHIRPDGFSKVRPWDSTEVTFAGIQAARVWHVPYFGGRFSLTDENGNVHQFTAALERSEYLLEAAYAARPDLIAVDKLLRFRRTAVTSDHSWARLTDRARFRRAELAALFLLLPALGFGVSWPFLSNAASGGVDTITQALGMLVSIVVLNFTLGLLAASAGEIYLLSRGSRALAKNPNELRRDPELEARVNHFVVWGHLALFCFFIGAAITAFAPQ